MRYDDVTSALLESYGSEAATARDGLSKEPWKIAERDAFLARLRSNGATSLLEIGAGTGQDSSFFAAHGLDVTATDLSPAMVESCRGKGLDAHVVDVLRIAFPNEAFDAAYSMNCLLHVPNADLGAVFANVRRMLRPGGLFYLGVWGGDDAEGVREDDNHTPPRFFSFRSPATMAAFVREYFEVENSHMIEDEHPFQSFTLRRPADKTG